MKEIKSQASTNVLQSRRLLELGLKPETADMGLYYSELSGDYRSFTAFDVQFDEDEIPAWSLHRLMVMLNMGTIITSIGLETAYDHTIKAIESRIKKGKFNRDYLK